MPGHISRYVLKMAASAMAGRFMAGATLESAIACHPTLVKKLTNKYNISNYSETSRIVSPSRIGIVLDYIDEGTYPNIYNDRCIAAASMDSKQMLGYKVPIMVAVKISGLGLSSDSSGAEVDRVLLMLDSICEIARIHGNKVTIDAETVALHPIVCRLTNSVLDMHLDRVMNGSRNSYRGDSLNDNTNIISDNSLNMVARLNDLHIFKTIQMYRSDSLKELEEFSREFPHAGIKLVRGAYHNEDMYTNRLYNSKLDTDKAYNKAIEILLGDDVRTGLYAGQYIIATHNSYSSRLAMMYDKIEYAKHLEYNRVNDKTNVMRCHYAQLFGMSDNLGNNILKNTHDDVIVYKYVPYGPLDVAIPYLIRRLIENWKMIKYLS